MKRLLGLYSWIHAVIAALFGMAALMLIVIAARVAWSAFAAELDASAAEVIIEAMGLLAAAVVALQISQTIAEEEVVRNAQISAPTRVRRFLSRFMVVIVVAVAVEALVATFKAREHPELLLYAAATLTAVGVLLAAWGLFVRLNRYAEELEPEAMAEAKREDEKLK
jgi:TRAP-type mannitol/chloroaromatic compound transport system permease small subunit